MVMDFAENYACQYQDEVQSAHWNHNQVTIHPISSYYACSSCDGVVNESLVFISNDLTHDYHAVQNFVSTTMQHLRCQRHLDVEHVVQWTDGCSSQYKSKGPFAGLAFNSDDFAAQVGRHFFGSRHGKGPSDGESAVVKSHASTAVKAGTAMISDGHEFFVYCTNSRLNKQAGVGCQHFVRTFFWVPAGTINRDRPERVVKTVPGTRDFHEVKSGGRGVICARHLTCFCEPCLTGEGECVNEGIVGSFSETILIPAPTTAAKTKQAAPALSTPGTVGSTTQEHSVASDTLLEG